MAPDTENTDDRMFMTSKELDNFSGIKMGKRVAGQFRNKEQLQIDWLRSQGIPFYINARGCPKILWAALLGARTTPPQQKPSWQPRVIRSA